MCGKIKLACFDKTGTLTHDGLDMHSVLPSSNAIFKEPVTNSFDLPHYTTCIEAMASCHSLAHVNEQLAGDPLDLSMFQFTNWVRWHNVFQTDFGLAQKEYYLVFRFFLYFV